MKRDKRICSVDKANVLEVTVLWREVMEEVAECWRRRGDVGAVFDVGQFVSFVVAVVVVTSAIMKPLLVKDVVHLVIAIPGHVRVLITDQCRVRRARRVARP